MYQELVSEGYDDIKIMGVNAKQYDYNSDTCMLCDCDSGSCIEDRILPWAQDTLDFVYDEYVEESICEDNYSEDGDELVWHSSDDYCFDPYAWGLWDVLIRDFFILDRNGSLVAKINLTYNNPDQNENCGNNYDLIKELLIQSR